MAQHPTVALQDLGDRGGRVPDQHYLPDAYKLQVRLCCGETEVGEEHIARELSTAGMDLLSIAKSGKNVQELKEALQKSHVGAALDPSTGRTSLHFASKAGNVEFVSCILEYLRDQAPEEVFFRQQVNAGDHMGFTALSLAVRYSQLPIVELLLDAGAAVQPTGDPLSKKRTTYGVDFSDALLIGVDLGNEEVVRVLLAHTTSVSKLSREGVTALHIAVENLDRAMIVALLNAGADIGAVSRAGVDPLRFAAELGDEHFRKLVTLLLNSRELSKPVDYAALQLPPRLNDIVQELSTWKKIGLPTKELDSTPKRAASAR
eukprot:CAMPEP_0114620638 /NCGR_PEP_ID=MMETSP0168-20121206/8828_1 /TAXON_ID=95228 ORGANISM="Vannella sp., Strain DIVA3 517/6/12" /NCGR_SAMPLE_ID=MMETSP0168 /ASSEMBLY_ACC=CAM_ASM_000044 /LENGTH=317 /DNA_ID=CAMNT_0001831835 /DNA_START=110 /DNA_END=1061 /DNA_ORIENTATION=-